MIVICQDSGDLDNALEVWKSRGNPLRHFSPRGQEVLDEQDRRDLEEVSRAGGVPVIGIKGESSSYSRRLDDLAMKIASYLTVDKVFFLSRHEGLVIDKTFISHLTTQEARSYLDSSSEINIGFKRFSFFIEQNIAIGSEIVMLRGESGCLFQEIFTHRGKGTMIANEYPNIIRRGELSDVMDICLMIKPYLQSGVILPVSEDQIARDVDAFYVYTVNNFIVAISKLTDYGPAFELAKFCTLPRYQGKGRARELAEKMIQLARKSQKKYIFSLSVEPKMFEFFLSLGFAECDRSDLPRDWKANYDMNRTSRAFKLMIS
jgi:amino-acid N-acetyltransferase